MIAVNVELEFATNLAREAGKIMLEHFQLGVPTTIKGDQSPVTLADTQVNSLVIERVKGAYPGHGVLGEEESHEGDGEYHWVCDPVDGTIPFAAGMPTNVFSLALVKDGQPELGILYDPYLDRMFAATSGRGATVNDRPIRVSATRDLKRAQLVCTGVADTGLVDYWKLRCDLESTAENALMEVRSSQYMATMVAAGQVAGMIFSGRTAHDGAAVKIIVEEAGGSVTDLDGNENQRYDQPINGYVISNGLIHDQLLEIVARHRTKS